MYDGKRNRILLDCFGTRGILLCPIGLTNKISPLLIETFSAVSRLLNQSILASFNRKYSSALSEIVMDDTLLRMSNKRRYGQSIYPLQIPSPFIYIRICIHLRLFLSDKCVFLNLFIPMVFFTSDIFSPE
jgi:hypothetical protein